MSGEPASGVDQRVPVPASERPVPEDPEVGTTGQGRRFAATVPPRRWRRGGPVAVLALLLLGFLALRILVLTRGDIIRTADSLWYGSWGDDGLLDSGPVLSFTGHAPRLWGTPLFYLLFSNDAARVTAQWTLSTIAWALLAWVVWHRLRTMLARVLAALGILALALQPEVANWDFALLSESLTISLGVLTLALLIWWLATGHRAVLVALVVAAFYWTFIRPEIRVMVACVALALAARALRRRERRWSGTAAVVVLIAGMGWVTLITPTMSKTFGERATNGLALEQATLTYRLRFDVMPDPDVLAVYEDRLGMPHCAAAVNNSRLPGWRMSTFVLAYQSCPNLVAWGDRNATSSTYRFAFAAPRLYYDQIARKLPAELAGGVRATGTQVLPRQVDQLFFVHPHQVLPRLGVAFGSALALGLVVLLTGLAQPRQQRLVLLTGIGTALVCLASAVVDVTFAAGEADRFGIQEAIGLRVALIVMVVAAVDAILRRIRFRRAEPPAPAAEPAVPPAAEPLLPAAVPAVPPVPAVEPPAPAAVPAEPPAIPTSRPVPRSG